MSEIVNRLEKRIEELEVAEIYNRAEQNIGLLLELKKIRGKVPKQGIDEHE